MASRELKVPFSRRRLMGTMSDLENRTRVLYARAIFKVRGRDCEPLKRKRYIQLRGRRQLAPRRPEPGGSDTGVRGITRHMHAALPNPSLARFPEPQPIPCVLLTAHADPHVPSARFWPASTRWRPTST